MVLRVKDVAKVTALSVATVYRDVAAGRFPRPIRLSPNTSGWLRDEVEEWVRERAANARIQTSAAA